MTHNKILILGSNGFIGQNLKKLLAKNNNYICEFLDHCDLDFKNYNILQQELTNRDPTIVINCSGIIGSSELNKQMNQFDIFNDNLILNANILNCCKTLPNLQSIIMFSTYRIFDDSVRYDYDESDIHNIHNKYINNAGYLASKQILHQQIHFFNKNYGPKIVCFVIPNIFGYYDSFVENARIVPSFIKKMDNCIKNNQDMFVSCDGNILVNLIFVEDIAKIVEQCIVNNCHKQEIIVFNRHGTWSLKYLAYSLKNIMGFKKNILFNSEEPLELSNLMAPNLDTFYNCFPEFKFTTIVQALESTVQFYNSINN